MSFLVFNNTNIEFIEPKKLIQRSYLALKASSTTSQVELIYKKAFTKVVLGRNSEIFVVYIIVVETKALVHLLQVAQIAIL